jgi:1,4-dihydroxy-6-naphthoate synthase
LKVRLCHLLRQSIDYALAHRDEALGYAIRYARGLEDDKERSDRFVGMYVNHWTQDFGDAGRRAVRLFLERAHQAGLLPKAVEAEFVEV